MLSGSYIHCVDEKCRVAMPARFRGLLGGECVLTKGPDGCLWALGKEEWRLVAARGAK
ncbi:MAG: MraZ N-terminal domain containing protein [Armatimonadetes bacterium]|nr:MraZ N-terminal domain containing protein [Armatimonadota bacterium]